ncbi:CaeNaCin (Caenorhabditis bacteriocin) [Caenorhabditis elegans]|uniref:CaeNaCin (Caenorhabditis bacteriocin) n=1 Tax=Caenorhabditis elegans TaxID=6239 RepID=Q9XVW3_CAEEL|nr:CaeNaCin (Caenorhabditis bacteriocin) [Caenorhabditis elegans]CAA92131.1 CaeNaCin (Caenorhabditis bacteriocin) [Caenorhabditis elegans]|eukprot:NP_509728.1 CaeNaCin (Caenorhabditis bacteriocin) [Caenorhabditis elegans]
MQLNVLLVFLATIIGLASAQWGYGRPYGGYGGYGGGYGGYGPRPWGPRPWGPRPTVIEKTVIIRNGPWAHKV